jgi:cell division protein FtsL
MLFKLIITIVLFLFIIVSFYFISLYKELADTMESIKTNCVKIKKKKKQK